ncbi:poly(A)-specific ribonuclease PARN [Phragmites australis]|uniref:poly(A)-specific ribonuclease PARN n=1 Tax=Phragmites australis TaxID=29695 RepID=UPI002D76BEFF|nr:poly(A)-specific ribonuclease PARN [Phragmites australis]
MQGRLRRLLRAPPPRARLSRVLSSSPPASSGDGDGGGVAVKQVTRGNLAESLEELRGRVRDAAFVGLDLEMSGVTSAPWRDTFELDRADVRYLKLRDSAERFAALQLGVCPFRWDPAKSAFVAHPHNFFIFPRKELPSDCSTHEFLCQTTSIDFLAKYQFDFNTCFREGISYLSRAQEEEALQKLNLLYHNNIYASSITCEEDGDMPLKSAADILFTERMKIKFNEWRDVVISKPRVDSHLPGNINCSQGQFQTVFFKMRPAVMLNGFSSHQLKLIQQVLRKNFRDLVYVCTFSDDDTSEKRVVYSDTKEDKIMLMKDVQEDLLRSREARVKSAIGIRHVIDLLSSERKLIVGHSCFLDIAQVYSKFIGPLPSSMKEFASGIHKIFPHIADTRHLMSANQTVQNVMKHKSKSLSSAFSLLCPTPYSSADKSSSLCPLRIEVEGDETTSSCFISGGKHEAGYDAYMTGCVFVQLCTYLDIKFEQLSPQENLATNNKMQKHINFLSPSWNSGTVVDLSTGKERPDPGYMRRYPAPVYDNIVLIWGFQSKVRAKDIKDCICKVFGPASVMSVFSIDSTAVLVQFSKLESVNDFLDLKAVLERTDSAISILHPLSTILEGGQTRAAKYDTYRDICSSSESKFLFADQAEAVCAASKNRLQENVDDNFISGVHETILDGKRLNKGDGRKSGSKNQDDNDISCQDILDALHDGRALFGKRMRS